tara:strand:+ start:1778 stop:2659 length:882 start_codon:yes stop_codon:yes gene_type:complete
MVNKKTIVNRFDMTALSETFAMSAMINASPEGPWVKPEYVSYVKNQNPWNGITYFTDKCLHLAYEVKSDIKVAILLEPREFMPSIYKNIKIYENSFDLIFTYDEELLNNGSSKYVFAAADMPSIPLKDCKIHKKSKLISMLISNKKITSGHKLRHIIVNDLFKRIGFTDKIDLFGAAVGNFIDNKAEACNDYMFQIATENSRKNKYFADKILDCFITGCIPIYWGAPDIAEYFDPRGILSFETPNELVNILKNINEEMYYSMLEYAKINFDIALTYQKPDDFFILKTKELLNA